MTTAATIIIPDPRKREFDFGGIVGFGECWGPFSFGFLDSISSLLVPDILIYFITCANRTQAQRMAQERVA